MMQEAGSSGVSASVATEEDEIGIEKNDGILFSPQDFVTEPLMVSTASVIHKRGRPPKQMDALTVPIGNEVDYNTIQFPVACDICSNVYGNGNILMNHMKVDHADFVPFECGLCCKPFAKMTQLQKHMASHGPDKQFECPICQQRFSRQDCVKVHMRIHDKSKCVHCDVCEKSFLTQGALNIHLRIHRGEKPFKCHLCGKCFTQKNHVIMHIMRHSRVSNPELSKNNRPRMFQCESCPRAFIRLSDFERHMQWTHGTVATNIIAGPATAAPRQTGNKMKPIHIKSFYEKLTRQQPKTSCTIATQTEESAEHTIIPTKYQSHGSTTPRAEEDLYENEMYDEGMDRNYSSDEDEANQSQPFVGMTNFGTSISDVNEAFDAVLGNTSNSNSTGEKTTQSHSDSPPTVEQDIPKELSKSTESNVVVPRDEVKDKPKIIDEIKEEGKKASIKLAEKDTTQDANKIVEGPIRLSPSLEVQDADVSLSSIYNRNSEEVISSRTVPKIKCNFDMSNWRCTEIPRGRGRGRSKQKMIMGLRGAEHLRLMRKSLMNFISEQSEPDEYDEVEEPDRYIDAPVEVSGGEVMGGKRQAKAKRHGKDFMCSSKTCDICLPPVKREPPPLTNPVKRIKKELPLSQNRDKSKKLLQFILSGDASTLEGTDFRLLSEVEGEKEEIFQGYNSSVDLDRMQSGTGDEQVNIKPNDQIQSEETVDFQSVCIPTFSCKLCGREFRFEGKLHRHIESVHQKKVIFTPDVKPGLRRIKIEEIQQYNKPIDKKQPFADNPELAALRSEWDDDEDEVMADKRSGAATLPEPALRQFSPKVTPMYSNQQFGGRNFVNRQYQREYASNSYTQGVKLNFNKFGRSMFSQGRTPIKIKTEPVKLPVAKGVSLENKCSQLLEKLFKLNLLMKCGHRVDHVSTVLGRVLLHYGVKMIEDYGQGQYEVLKYNLWRLIEWKVTMEQMEEFYTQGKSVEEMMDDIMNSRVPITAHTEPAEKKSAVEPELIPAPAAEPLAATSAIEMMPISDQLVISQVALDGNVTQLMLAQDVSPEMLQGAHIVTLDPNTGQVISQVTADQVMLAGSVSEELTRQIESIDSHIVVSSHSSSSSTTSIVSALPPGSILAHDGTIHIGSATIEGELIESDDAKSQHSDANK